ncbi:MAG: hypothetical protein J6R08_05010 [Opitutales bacterium]|nr:hypothetical protein [Opitutales bacterium]
MGSFFKGEDHDMPKAKDYSDAYGEGVDALVSSISKMLAADKAYSGAYNDLFTGMQSDSLSSYNQDIWNLQKAAIEASPEIVAAQLAYQKEYSPQFTALQDQLNRQADPTYWGIRDALGAQVESDLAKGNELSDAQKRITNQSSRAAMAARGGSAGGYAPAAQEVLGEFLAGEGIKTQRQNAATNFLNLGANSATSAPEASVATSGYSTLTPYMYSNAANAGQNSTNYNNAIYNQKVQWYQNENNQPSLFSTLVGSVTSGIGAGAMMGNALKE